MKSDIIECAGREKAGGIDQSQDREIERAKDELGGLKARVGDLELMEKILHKWDRGRIRYRDF